MAAASRHAANSPTAQLLRSSRLFSLPKPLPRPAAQSNIRSKLYQNSPTATSAYPTHQAITTTHASRARGDWGLKRPLPAKASSKAQAVRVKELDTYDQVVEFEHAQDHTLTLQKLQDLNLAITRPDAQGSHYAIRAYHDPSAFEPEFDNVAIKPKPDLNDKTTSRESNLQTRWRRRGPDLAGMSEAEFEEYLSNVRNRSKDFMRDLQWRAIREYVRSAKEDSVDGGSDEAKLFSSWLAQLAPAHLYAYVKEKTPRTWLIEWPKELETELEGEKEGENAVLRQFAEEWLEMQITAKTRANVMKDLPMEEEKFPQAVESFWTQYWINFRNRSGDDDSARLVIEEFLDLPRIVPGSEFDPSDGNSILSTHPSAGLSYRRTNQVLNNDPLYGPLIFDTPHAGRYLPMPAGGRASSVPKASDYSIGVAGVVASRERMVSNVPTGITDERTPRGGPKLMLNVLKTEITPSGRINLEARESLAVEQAVTQNKLQKAIVEDAELKAQRDQIQSTPQVNPSTLPSGNKAVKGPGNIHIEL